MNDSILKQISEYAIKNNISVNGIYYNFENVFPSKFYETVIYYLKKVITGYKDDIKIKDFFIGFDKNKNAYFEFVGNGKETPRIIVLANNINYDCVFYPSLKIKEDTFLDSIKRADEEKNKEILEKLPDEFKRRFIKENPINNFFNELANNITTYMYYIDYLAKQNQKEKSYELLQKEIDNKDEVEKIYFIESEPSENKEKTDTPTGTITKDRKNTKIPFAERKNALDSYAAEHIFEANAKNTDAKYYVKVFKTNGKYKLVTEPKEATKYTKVIYIDKSELSKKEAIEITIKYLELSRNEITETQNITRHSHTTLEEYKKLLEYLINENDLGLSYSTKKRIDEANETKIR